MKPTATRALDYMKTLYTRYSSIGLYSNVELEDIKFVQYTNITVALTALGFLFYIFCSVLQGNYTIAAIQSIELSLTLTVLLINYSGHNKLARMFFLFLVNGYVLLNSCYIGYASGVHDFFYVCYMMPFLYFRIKDFRNIFAGLVMAIAGFITYQHIYPYFTEYNLDPASQQVVFNINVWMKFGLYGISVYIIAYYNFSSEKTVAVSQVKLQYTEELKQKNEDLEQFAYIISHDLKTPVRNMASFMKLLLKRNTGTLDATSVEYIELARTGAERMMMQINDLLSYCRVGRDHSTATTVDVNEIIKSVKQDLQEKAKGMDDRVVAVRPLPVLNNVQPGMLYHIFQNLISNGLKFNTNPRPLVLIDFCEKNGMVHFSVKDNGIGIPKGYEEKIFQMFQRLHQPEEFEGTGIGLAVCKKIATMYNGNVWFESKPGMGSTFYFSVACKILPPTECKQQKALHTQQPIPVV